ncbi:MAG: hypothetical protein ACXU8O_05360 [Asticcacaulis sp.]
MDGFYIAKLTVESLIGLAIVYNLFHAAVHREVNSFGLGWADKTSSPGLFVAYILLNLIILLMLFGIGYSDYVRLFGHIPGFYPETVISTLSGWLRHLPDSK